MTLTVNMRLLTHHQFIYHICVYNYLYTTRFQLYFNFSLQFCGIHWNPVPFCWTPLDPTGMSRVWWWSRSSWQMSYSIHWCSGSYIGVWGSVTHLDTLLHHVCMISVFTTTSSVSMCAQNHSAPLQWEWGGTVKYWAEPTKGQRGCWAQVRKLAPPCHAYT